MAAVMSSLLKLRNLGPKTVTALEAVGINSVEDLRTHGAVEAYRRLKAYDPHKFTLLALWALQGALLDIHWNHIPLAIKNELMAELDRR